MRKNKKYFLYMCLISLFMLFGGVMAMGAKSLNVHIREHFMLCGNQDMALWRRVDDVAPVILSDIQALDRMAYVLDLKSARYDERAMPVEMQRRYQALSNNRQLHEMRFVKSLAMPVIHMNAHCMEVAARAPSCLQNSVKLNAACNWAARFNDMAMAHGVNLYAAALSGRGMVEANRKPQSDMINAATLIHEAKSLGRHGAVTINIPPHPRDMNQIVAAAGRAAGGDDE